MILIKLDEPSSLNSALALVAFKSLASCCMNREDHKCPGAWEDYGYFQKNQTVSFYSNLDSHNFLASSNRSYYSLVPTTDLLTPAFITCITSVKKGLLNRLLLQCCKPPQAMWTIGLAAGSIHTYLISLNSSIISSLLNSKDRNDVLLYQQRAQLVDRWVVLQGTVRGSKVIQYSGTYPHPHWATLLTFEPWGYIYILR